MDDNSITSYHESGHCVMAILLGARVSYISLEPDFDDQPRRWGETKTRWPKGRLTWRAKAIVSMAGPAAELIYRGEILDIESIKEFSADWQMAMEAMAESNVPAAQSRSQLQLVFGELRQFLTKEEIWQAIASLADELQAHQTIYEEEIRTVFDQWLG